MQLLFPLSAAAQASDGILKIDGVWLTEVELSVKAAEALVCEGKLRPTVGDLSHGKYPVSKSPSTVDVMTGWIPVALKIFATASIGLVTLAVWSITTPQ